MPQDHIPFTVIQVDLSDDTTVAHAPTTVETLLQPPEGYAYQLIMWNIRMPDPAGSAAGTHTLRCHQQGLSYIDNRLWQAVSNTGTDIVVGRYFQIIATTDSPSQSSDQSDMMRGGCWATHAMPIIFEYTNGTDVDQSGTRKIQLLVKKYFIGV